MTSGSCHVRRAICQRLHMDEMAIFKTKIPMRIQAEETEVEILTWKRSHYRLRAN